LSAKEGTQSSSTKNKRRGSILLCDLDFTCSFTKGREDCARGERPSDNPRGKENRVQTGSSQIEVHRIHQRQVPAFKGLGNKRGDGVYAAAATKRRIPGKNGESHPSASKRGMEISSSVRKGNSRKKRGASCTSRKEGEENGEKMRITKKLCPA